jgi:hypothetical protein
MYFANANSDALLKADPYIEIGIAILCFLGSGLVCLDFHLQHRKNNTGWTRQQIQRCLVPLGIGLMFVFFCFGPHN